MYFNVDNFEDCHCTDGHQEEQGCLNHGQGVYKTPGEAPTGKRSGLSSRSRPATTIRTGAKDGPSAPHKVQTTNKPEETPRQDEKGTIIY